jgi:acetyl-CoA acetyltransferase
MSSYGAVAMPPSDPALSRRAAIVGVGETDYAADYRAARARAPGYEPPTPESLSLIAFERALGDAGLERGDIDGLTTSFIYGGPEPEETAALLGLKPRLCTSNGNIMAGPLPNVCARIASGEAETVAMVYASVGRGTNRLYGGTTYGDLAGTPQSYYYYHPWGWSPQSAHWAMMASFYFEQFGRTETDLASVAMQVRAHAVRHPNAVMQQAMSLEEYLAVRYIVRPLRLYDICMVNDGAVCLIVRRSNLTRADAKPPVLVAGWGEGRIRGNKMEALVRDRLVQPTQAARDAALSMSGINLNQIGHFEGYDASSFHLIGQVESMGFTPPGTGLDFCKAGEMDVTGRMPTNTGGGNLSGSYMHGWSQVVEAVRQLRGEAHGRQIGGLSGGHSASLTSLAQTDQVHPIVLTRDA